MRNGIVLIGMIALGGCGGAGVQSAGSSSTVGSASTDKFTEFAKPTTSHTYVGVGGTQVYTYETINTGTTGGAGQQQQLYAGNATAGVRNSGISITYSPTDGIFTLTVADTKSGASTNTRFQDPAHRTNFGGAVQPQWGVPNLPDAKNVRYLQVSSGTGVLHNDASNTAAGTGEDGSSSETTTLFYEVPGTSTQYVSYAGYIRNKISNSTITIGAATDPTQNYTIERGAFAYGALTDIANVPKSGTGAYTGSMLATMVNNPTIDGWNGPILPTYAQWIYGTSSVNVDFGAGTVALGLSGTVTAPQVDNYTAPATAFIAAGSTFTASGTATIDLAGTGGFTGTISDAKFTSAGGTTLQHLATTTSVTQVNKVEGAIAGSSIAGAFYGPGGTVANTEVGGGFRIVGGTPDQRIDILGAFTGGVGK